MKDVRAVNLGGGVKGWSGAKNDLTAFGECLKRLLDEHPGEPEVTCILCLSREMTEMLIALTTMKGN